MPPALEDKTVIVTGAARGIGLAEARSLASLGAQVVMNDVDAQKCELVAEDIREAGGTALPITGDVASWEVARALVDGAVRHFGRLDALVNNAGISRDRMSFNLEEDAWDAMVRVNLKGHFAPIHWAAAYWRQMHKDGETVEASIVNTSSRAGLFGAGGMSGYSSTKAGIVGMTLSLSQELEQYGVRCNAVVPRAYTRLMHRMVSHRTGMTDEGKRALAPTHVAQFVGFLVGDRSVDINGAVFLVEGDSIRILRPWKFGPEFVVEGGSHAAIGAGMEGLLPEREEFDLYAGLDLEDGGTPDA